MPACQYHGTEERKDVNGGSTSKWIAVMHVAKKMIMERKAKQWSSIKEQVDKTRCSAGNRPKAEVQRANQALLTFNLYKSVGLLSKFL